MVINIKPQYVFRKNYCDPFSHVMDRCQCSNSELVLIHEACTIAFMPRSHIHGSPRRFYYGLNLTDDPGNANFRSPIRMRYTLMIKYYYV